MTQLKQYHHASGQRKVNLNAWKKQSIDSRDIYFSLKLFPTLLSVPTKADNRQICSPIEDQGQLGSCTANAFAALVEANENRRLKSVVNSSVLASPAQVSVANVATTNGKVTFNVTVTPATSTPTPTPAPAPTPSKLTNLSRLFQYYITRQIEGTTISDSGATIRDTIKAAAKFGCVDENLWPYDVNKFAVKPPQNVWNVAATHKVTSYHSIADGDINTMKSVLSAQIPFLIEFGFNVYDHFLSADMTKTGMLCKPTPDESLQGGHAVVLVGYDDNMKMPDGSTGAFLVRNSWGTGWGWQGTGYFWMAYNYISDTSLCSDFWVVNSAPL